MFSPPVNNASNSANTVNPTVNTGPGVSASYSQDPTSSAAAAVAAAAAANLHHHYQSGYHANYHTAYTSHANSHYHMHPSHTNLYHYQTQSDLIYPPNTLNSNSSFLKLEF